jgi:BNR repeat-containing family member
MPLCRSLTRGAAVIACALVSACQPSPPTHATPLPVVTFNDNGSWCWYQAPRVIVDQTSGTVLVGSVAAAEGPGGDTRSGDVDVVSFDIASGKSTRVVLDQIVVDDHDAPGLLIRTDGRYLAMYSNHNHDKLSRYRISSAPHDGTGWGDKERFDWETVKPDFNTTYSNVYFLSAEQVTYDFSRSDNRSPNILTSTDEGETWTWRGKLTESVDVGYVNGYFRYASNGVDQIDVVGTEHHPHDYNTSIYHGHLKGGKAYFSDGVTVLDDDIFDDKAPAPADFTPVFRAGTEIGGVAMTHAWPSDLKLDAQGNPHVIFTARAHDDPENTNFSDHRFLHARFDGSAWQVHELARAGAPLFPAEEDYTGLASFNPGDLNTVYLSTAIDPRDGSSTPRHEIYAGTTSDGGATWSWTAITLGSEVDNIRPVAPAWDGKHTALLWLHGTMTFSQHYDMAVVGMIFEGSLPAVDAP